LIDAEHVGAAPGQRPRQAAVATRGIEHPAPGRQAEQLPQAIDLGLGARLDRGAAPEADVVAVEEALPPGGHAVNVQLSEARGVQSVAA
jgi:hypothetical protein